MGLPDNGSTSDDTFLIFAPFFSSGLFFWGIFWQLVAIPMVVLEWVMSGPLQTPQRDGPTAKGSFLYSIFSSFFFYNVRFKRLEPETIYKWTWPGWSDF